jgi:hypothetical protein
MSLKAYFEKTKGAGVLATANKDGKVGAAIYSQPHFQEDGSLAFIMRDRLTHDNLQTNPSATYLFIEDGPGYQGKRLFLKKIREEENSELLQKLSRRKYVGEITEPRFLVFFTIDKELPLVGTNR